LTERRSAAMTGMEHDPHDAIEENIPVGLRDCAHFSTEAPDSDLIRF